MLSLYFKKCEQRHRSSHRGAPLGHRARLNINCTNSNSTNSNNNKIIITSQSADSSVRLQWVTAWSRRSSWLQSSARTVSPDRQMAPPAPGALEQCLQTKRHHVKFASLGTLAAELGATSATRWPLSCCQGRCIICMYLQREDYEILPADRRLKPNNFLFCGVADKMHVCQLRRSLVMGYF